MRKDDIRHNSFMASFNEEKYEEGNQYARVSTLLAHHLEGIPEKQYGKQFYDFVLKKNKLIICPKKLSNHNVQTHLLTDPYYKDPVAQQKDHQQTPKG